MDALIFDIDGTLWDTRAIVAKGYNVELEKMGRPDLFLTADYLTSLFGKTAQEIADVIFAEYPAGERMELILRCMETERLVMAADPCNVGYEGVKETLLELKKFYHQFYPSFSEEIFQKLQSAIDLPLNKKISKFSKGMKRQAIVIVGLACCTPYLLLDEAFDGLDPTMRIIVKKMIVDAMCERELTVIISSHNLKEINEMCDTAALLHKGKIVFHRELDSFKGSVHKIQVVFADREREYTREDFKDVPEILHFERTQSIYHIIAKGEEDTIRKALAPYDPIVTDLIPLSLEEIFIYELEVLGYDSKVFN